MELPPTPSKFHYIFNLKDLSRIFAGMLLIRSNFFKEPRELTRVWRNEFTRIICDRLISHNVSMRITHAPCCLNNVPHIIISPTSISFHLISFRFVLFFCLFESLDWCRFQIDFILNLISIWVVRFLNKHRNWKRSH